MWYLSYILEAPEQDSRAGHKSATVPFFPFHHTTVLTSTSTLWSLLKDKISFFYSFLSSPILAVIDSRFFFKPTTFLFLPLRHKSSRSRTITKSPILLHAFTNSLFPWNFDSLIFAPAYDLSTLASPSLASRPLFEFGNFRTKQVTLEELKVFHSSVQVFWPPSAPSIHIIWGKKT